MLKIVSCRSLAIAICPLVLSMKSILLHYQVVSKDGRKVRRLHPLLITEVKDTKVFLEYLVHFLLYFTVQYCFWYLTSVVLFTQSCTVIVENLPDDYSTDNLQKIFANIGRYVFFSHLLFSL